MWSLDKRETATSSSLTRTGQQRYFSAPVPRLRLLLLLLLLSPLSLTRLDPVRRVPKRKEEVNIFLTNYVYFMEFEFISPPLSPVLGYKMSKLSGNPFVSHGRIQDTMTYDILA